jgi:hypothetical protein
MKDSAATFLAIVFLSSSVPAIAGLASSEHQPSDLSKALNQIMSVVTPDLYFHKRETMVDEYEKAKVNKAIAVNVKKAEYWESTDQDSMSVTAERTLEGCQLRFGSPCKLLVVNDELAPAAGPTAEQDMSRLQYSGGFDLNQLPIVKDEVRKRADVQSYLSASQPKAIALHPIGQMFVFSGRSTSREAAETVLARCNLAPGRKKADGPCYLYALNNDVVIAKRQTAP